MVQYQFNVSIKSFIIFNFFYVVFLKIVTEVRLKINKKHNYFYQKLLKVIERKM